MTDATVSAAPRFIQRDATSDRAILGAIGAIQELASVIRVDRTATSGERTMASANHNIMTILFAVSGAVIVALGGVAWWVVTGNTEAIGSLTKEVSDFRVEVVGGISDIKGELKVTNTKLDTVIGQLKQAK